VDSIRGAGRFEPARSLAVKPGEGKGRRVGFVSTRFAGTDGVTLETWKWVSVLEEMDFQCFFFSGECELPRERSMVIPEAHFKHPEIQDLQADLFGGSTRTPYTSETVRRFKERLKSELYRFVLSFKIDLLIVENALSLPMHVPLGLALAEFIAETNMPAIAHHHDFYWERTRFALNGADDYLQAAFPPAFSALHHVVINSFAQRQLARRTGVAAMVVPNVMRFDEPPPPPDDVSSSLRAELGIAPDECLLLQPTRIVPRKRIEKSFELARMLDRECVVVVSHSAGDEGLEYQKYLQRMADLLGVRVVFASGRIERERGTDAEGRRVYGLRDAYAGADLVTYPSAVEGFGNAFLESIYFKCPIFISAYETYETDIKPKGFRMIEFHEFIEDETLESVRRVLDDAEWRREIVEHNYELGRMHYSFETLRSHLASLLGGCVGCSECKC